ncbi:MAG: PKD domain-containing protein [Nitrospirae bacterium]|nr:PKD domain-containing protein [Nitrospirota bacterium]
MIKRAASITAVLIIFIQLLACSFDLGNKSVAPAQQVNVLAGPEFGTAPLTVQFNAAGPAVSSGGTVSYLWNFDDGRTSTEASPQHTFNYKGTYMIALTVTGASGVKDTGWVVIIVN